MTESSFLKLFRSRWQEIARQFWPETPHEQLQSELARLDAELDRRQNRLLILRKRIERLRYDLNLRERNLTRQAAQAQEMRTATAVDPERKCRRRNIDRLRERLQKYERGYAQRLVRLRKLKQKRTQVRKRLLCGSLPKRTSDECDPDYPF